jgi:hypothetical protein
MPSAAKVAVSGSGDDVVHHLDQAVKGVAVPVLLLQRPASFHVKGPGELGGQDLGRRLIRRLGDAPLGRETVQVPVIM